MFNGEVRWMVWDGCPSIFGFRHERDDHNPHSMGPSTMIQSASMAATRKSSTWCVSQFRDVFLRSWTWNLKKKSLPTVSLPSLGQSLKLGVKEFMYQLLQLLYHTVVLYACTICSKCFFCNPDIPVHYRHGEFRIPSPYYSTPPGKHGGCRAWNQGMGFPRRKFGSVDAAFLSMSARGSQFRGNLVAWNAVETQTT